MKMNQYGDKMLMKQLKLAERKGNKEYSEQLKEELMLRGVMDRPAPAKKPPAKQNKNQEGKAK